MSRGDWNLEATFDPHEAVARSGNASAATRVLIADPALLDSGATWLNAQDFGRRSTISARIGSGLRSEQTHAKKGSRWLRSLPTVSTIHPADTRHEVGAR
jgi:hypothetical protein